MKKLYSNQSSKQSTKKSAPVNKKQARKPLISALEPRLLLDGAAVATAVDVLTDSQFHDAFQADASQQDTDASAVIAPTEVRAADPTLNNGKKEVVFIEDNVADYQTLIDGIGAGIEVVLLDSTQDGLAQMALWAESNSDYDAIHIISHGAEGQVNLGGFSLDNITVNTRSADLAQLGAALNEDGDLLLYGCEVASGEGQEFITALAQATQADVAASDDLTGAAVKGGDWELEKAVGKVSESSALSAAAMADYGEVFGSATLTGSGVVTLTGGSNSVFTYDNTTTVTAASSTLDNDWMSANGQDGALYVIDSFDTATDQFDLTAWNESNASMSTRISIANNASLDFALIDSNGDAENAAIMVGNGYRLSDGSIVNDNGKDGLGNDVDLTGATTGTIVFFYEVNIAGQVVVFLPNITSDQLSTANFIFEESSNNAPTITGAPTDITVTEDTASNVNLSGVTFADSDGDNLTITLTASAGTLAASSGGNVTVSGSGTGALTLSGTAADINSYLDTTSNVQYTGASNASGDNAATLTIKANDSTVDSSTSTVNIDITAVNDAPTAVSPTTGTVSTFDSANAVVATVGATDVDDTTFKYSIQSITLDSASQANDGSLFNFATDANTLVATNALRATTPSGLTAGTYIVTVVATDAEGLSKTQEITITVTDTLVVTTANDTSEDAADAYNGNSYAAELADGGGLSLREALGLAAAGGKTIAFAAGLNNLDISLDSQVTVADGTVFQLANGTSFTISGSNLLLNGGLTINNAASNNLTLSASLTDNGVVKSSFTKTGAGILTLGGTNNTATGGDTGTGLNTIVASDGRLQISADTNLGTDGVTLSGGVIFATAGNTFTLTNTFAIEEGGASFNQTGSGHLTLSNQVAGSGLLTKTGGGSMTLSENNDALDGGIKITNGTLNAKASVKSLGNETVTLDGGTLAFSDAGTVGNNITVSAAATISNSTNVILSGQISGSGVLTKAGAGTMTWSGTNTHSGDLIVSTGALAVSGGSSIGDNSAVTVSSGATLSLTGGNETIGSLSGSGAVALTYGLTVGNASNTTFSGAISSTNTSGITKVGSGTLTLNGTNTYTGATTVSAGKLLLQGGSAIADSSAVTISSGAELELRDNDEAVGSVAGAGVLTLNGGSLTTGGNNTDTTFSGVIEDGGNGGGLTKVGTGTLTLSGSNNTYTGTTSVLGGVLSIGGDSNLGSEAIILNSGTLAVTGDGANIDNAISILSNGGVVKVDTGVTATLSGIVSGTGALTKVGAGVLTLGATNTYTGATSVTDGTLKTNTTGINATSDLTLNGGTLSTLSSIGINKAFAVSIGSNGGTLDMSAGVISLSGVISGSGGLTVSSTSAGSTLTLSGDNIYTGGTTLNNGILQFNHDNAIGSGTLTIEGGKVRAGLASRTISNDLVLGNTLTFSGSHALTFSGGVNLGGEDRTIDNSISRDLTFSGVLSNGSLTIAGGAGTGAVILSGTNIHTNTTISGIGTGTNTNSLSIASDASLGTGTLTLNGTAAVLNITGATTIDNAILFDQNATISATNAVTLSGVVSGTGALTKSGTGVLTLSGNNADYSGNITLNQGVIIAAHNNALGNTTGSTTVASGTTLRVGNGLTLAENLTISGVGIDSSYGALKINEGTGSATVTGDITLAADSLIGAFNTGDSLTLSGVISGDFDLTKVGSGTLTLSGSNTHTGAVTVSGGTLALLGGSSIGDDSAVTVNSGTTLSLTGGNETIGSLSGSGAVALSYGLIVGNASNTAFTGVISSTNTSGITKVGSGTLALSGANTYTGATTVSAGKLLLQGGSAIADSSAVTISSGAELELRDNDEAVGSVAGAGALTLNGGTLTVGGNNSSTTFSGIIQDSGGLTKIGTGTLTLSGSNAYTGTTTVSSGTLVVDNSAALGTTAGGTVVESGATLQATAGISIADALTLSGTGVNGAGALVASGNGTVTASGAITLGAATTVAASDADTILSLSNNIAGTYGLTKAGTGMLSLGGNSQSFTTLTIGAGSLSAGLDANLGSDAVILEDGTLWSIANNGGTIDNAIVLNGSAVLSASLNTTLAGGISGSGSLTKQSGGTLTLSGSNSYTGTTTITGGTLAIGGDGNLGTGSLAMNGGTLSVTGSSVTIDNAISLGNNGGTVSNANAVTLSGLVSGTGALTKLASGILTLSNTGNEAAWSGGINVSAGTLAVGDDNVLSSGALNVTGGTLELGNSVNLDNTVTLGAGGVLTPATGSNATLSGDLILMSDATFNLANNANLAIRGIVSGEFGITKSGNATLSLTGNNSYTGTTTINAGMLTVGNSSALGSTSGSTIVNSGGSLNLSSGVSIAEDLTIIGTGSLSNGALVMRSSGTATVTGDITLSGNAVVKTTSSTHNLVLEGAISDGNNGYTLTKEGAGTVTLSGTNTYTGATNVSAGTLLVTGALNGTSAVTVSSGATLGASGNGNTGTIFAANSSNTVTVQSGGTLSPGLTSSVGLMTINGNLDLQSGSTLRVDIAGTTAGSLYDVVDVRGSVSLAGALTVNHNYTPGNGDTYRIITNDSADAITGTFTGLAEAATLTAGGNATVLTGYYAASDVAATTGGNDFMLRAPVNSPPTLTAGTATATLVEAGGMNNGTAGTNSASITLTKADADGTASYDTDYLINNGWSTIDSGATYTKIGVYGSASLNIATDVVSYMLNNSDSVTDALTSGQSVSDSFSVQVTDGIDTQSANVVFNITGANDTPVITSGATGNVNENAATSTVIYTAIATDVDNDTVTYSLTGDDAALLDINATTGEVTLKASADFETKASYSFNVVATDSGTGNLTDTQAVVVSINDVNEAPVMTSGATGSVNENADVATVIYTATATDVDANDTMTYSLTGDDAALLNINAATGEVTLKTSADYETKASYSFNVVATDSGTGHLTDTQAVVVSINDVNEAPVMTSGATGNVSENAATSTVIYTAIATDVDTNDSLTYSLTGDDAALLDINATTGEVTLKASADFETKASYSFNVVATDSGTGNLTDTQAVVVSINDVNEAPVMTSGATGSVNENADVATVIYTATATDVDANDTVTYSLTGDDAALLDINATTGEVTLKASADYETKASYSFNVVATDNGASNFNSGNLSVSQAVVVSINDMNEAPVITSGATGSVEENAAINTVIYTATATDVDTNDSVTYSLTGDDAALLDINTTTGEVTLKASANYETKASYRFNVVATDSGTGNLTDTQAVVVSINDVNETPVMTSGATGSVNENANVATVIYTATATDVDANDSVTYSLTGDDAALLDINATTGEVTLKASADYETKASYSFNVVATDNGASNFNSGNLSVSQAVVVSVNDLNDNAPTVSAGASTATLVEAGGANNTNAGTNSATITLTKGDVDTVGVVRYDAEFLANGGWMTTDNGETYSRTGDYGTAIITTSTDVIRYVLNNNATNTQSLTSGQSVTDSFTIQITDGNATAITTAVFEIDGANDTPIVSGTVANMSGTSGQIFTPVTLPANLFTDLDANDRLVWSIENLPTGLVFNAVTRTISGTPQGGFEGVNTLQVVATDIDGAQVKVPVTLTLNPAPVTAPASPVVDVAPVVSVQNTGFTAPDVTTTSTALPTGVVETSGGSRGFTEVTASSGVSQSQPVAEAPVNNAPSVGQTAGSNTVVVSESRVAVNVGANGQVQVSEASGVSTNTTGLTVATIVPQGERVSITIADTSTVARYSGTLADGTQLPDWVEINPTTGEVTMTPPPGQGTITLKVNAVDADGNVRILEIEVDLESLPQTAPADTVTNVSPVFMSLDDQLAVAAEQYDDYGSGLMKLLAS